MKYFDNGIISGYKIPNKTIYEVCVDYQGITRVVYETNDYQEAINYVLTAEPQIEHILNLNYYYIREIEVKKIIKREVK